MNDVLRALLIAAGILAPVEILLVIISIVTVKRGEVEMRGASHGLSDDSLHVKDVAAATPPPPVKGAKAGAPAGDEISVSHILILGVGLFVLTVLSLLALSFIQHLG